MKKVAPLCALALGIVLIVAGASSLVLRITVPKGITGEFDYQTGDFGQWHSIQEKAAGRATIQPSPVGDGKLWARYSVQPGDHLATTTSRERDEATLTPATTGAKSE